MTNLLGPETLEFFASFFLAGFVFMSVRSWFVAGERPKINETLIESLILSLINQVVALFTLGWLTQDLAAASPSVVLVVQNIVQPVFLGVLVGGLATQNFFPAGLRRLVMPTVRPVNPAVDFAFDQLSGPTFVILRFQNDVEVLGYFGMRSMIATDSGQGGIFLEDVYIMDSAGDWKFASPRRSAWIRTEGLHSIEFIEDEDQIDAEDTL